MEIRAKDGSEITAIAPKINQIGMCSTRRKLRSSVGAVRLFALCTALLPVTAFSSALPASFTDQDFNALVAVEATQNELAALTFLNGGTATPQILGEWMGMITSAGWNLAFSGTLDGTPLTFLQNGSLDTVAQIASWTGSGDFGGVSVSDSGMSAEDPSWTQLFIKIGGFVLIGGTELATEVASAGTATIANVTVSHVSFAIIDKVVDTSSETKPNPTLPPPPKPVGQLTGTGVVLDSSDATLFAITQVGTIDLTTGATIFTSTLSPQIPEPASVALSAGGLAGLLLLCLKRGFARHSGCVRTRVLPIDDLHCHGGGVRRDQR